MWVFWFVFEKKNHMQPYHFTKFTMRVNGCHGITIFLCQKKMLKVFYNWVCFSSNLPISIRDIKTTCLQVCFSINIMFLYLFLALMAQVGEFGVNLPLISPLLCNVHCFYQCNLLGFEVFLMLSRKKLALPKGRHCINEKIQN